MLYRRQRSWAERAEIVGVMLREGLRLTAIWLGFGWVLMLVVGNMYHAGLAQVPVGMWDACYVIAPFYLAGTFVYFFLITRK